MRSGGGGGGSAAAELPPGVVIEELDRAPPAQIGTTERAANASMAMFACSNNQRTGCGHALAQKSPS